MNNAVSLTMIVRNEEQHLHDCLAGVADCVQEIVVVDTGSTDATQEIATRFGARIYDLPWQDDFAAARNAALDRATMPWIFWMDADERLDAANQQRLRALIDSLPDENLAYVMNCVSPRDDLSGSATVTQHLRLFRNNPRIRWRYRIHEQIRPAVVDSGGTLRDSDVVIRHLGYADSAALRQKALRNLRLLEFQNVDEPGNAFVLFNMGRCYKVLGQMAQAVSSWQASLQQAPPNALFLRRLIALLVDGLTHQQRRPEALALARQGLQLFPDDPELLFHEGTLQIELGDLAGGEACMRRILASRVSQENLTEEPHLWSKARHNLAIIYLRQARLAEAEAQLHQILQDDSDYPMAWLVLGQIWLGQGRWAEAGQAAEALETHPKLAAQGRTLRARIQAALGTPEPPRDAG